MFGQLVPSAALSLTREASLSIDQKAVWNL